VETAVAPPPLTQAMTEQEWEYMQSRERQKRIAEELSQLKAAAITEALDESKKDDETATDAKEGEEKSVHASLPFITSNVPIFHLPPSAQNSETHKILESVTQATAKQIEHLKDALQKQFEDQEKQMLELIARVDAELSGESRSRRERAPLKPNTLQQNLTIPPRPSNTVVPPSAAPALKPTLVHSASGLTGVEAHS